MRLAFPRFSKPPIGTPLDSSSDLQAGLAFFAPLWEGSGKKIHDVVQGAVLSFANTPVWAPGVGGVPYGGLLCNTSGAHATAGISVPPSLQYTWPITIAVGFTPITNVGVELFGVSGTSGSTIEIATAVTNTISMSWNTAGTAGNATAPNGITTLGAYNVVGFTIYGSTGYNLFVNGVSKKAAGGSIGNPTWGASPVWTIGADGNFIIYWCAAWNRAPSATEHAAVAKNIWQIFQPVYSLGALAGQPTGSLWFPHVRPVTDRSGSRRRIWAE